MFRVICWGLGRWSCDVFVVEADTIEQAKIDIDKYIQLHELNVNKSNMEITSIGQGGVVAYYHQTFCDEMGK